MPRHTTELQSMIVGFLSENGPSTASEISDALGFGYRDVMPSIMRMEGKRIRRAGWRDERRLWAVIG